MITRKKIPLASLLVIINVVAVFPQEYDSDSVYYTPIAKSKLRLKEGEVPNKIEYFFNIQTGALVGCNDCDKGKEFTFSAATVQGVTIGKKFRAGLGIGFDSYQNWQTLPVYGMISWDLIGNKTKSALFVQLNYGWAHPWFVRDGAYTNYNYDPFTDVKGGRMINPQMGYRMNYYSLRLSLAIGYKFQQIFYDSKQYAYCPYCDFTSTMPKTEITQDMNRVQLMMSVGWK
jgi:hypothetical protein